MKLVKLKNECLYNYFKYCIIIYLKIYPSMKYKINF